MNPAPRGVEIVIVLLFVAFLGVFAWLEKEKGWATFTDELSGLTFRYPERLSTFYITAFDWPPQIAIVDGPFTCTEAGEERARAGKTELRTIAGRMYCKTTLVEGAAGSIYTQYAYATPRGDKVAILTFSTRSAQCGNYQEERMNVCEKERETFDMDTIVDRVAQTL